MSERCDTDDSDTPFPPARPTPFHGLPRHFPLPGTDRPVCSLRCQTRSFDTQHIPPAENYYITVPAADKLPQRGREARSGEMRMRRGDTAVEMLRRRMRGRQGK